MREELGNTIYTFDWEGNPKVKYTLDRDIISIAVDESNEVLYALQFGEKIDILMYRL